MRRPLVALALLALLVPTVGPPAVMAATPGNDDFASATVIGTLPFGDVADTSEATAQAGEPMPSCGYGFPVMSVWYAYTPPAGASLTATSSGADVLAVYTGTTLESLSSIGCATWASLTFQATGGTTYLFQLTPLWGTGTPSSFSLALAPPPIGGFTYYPYDPSTFDTISFYDGSYDPAGIGIGVWAWDFGDGSTSTAQSPTHLFAADGDYTVVLAVTTTDGRTGSSTQVVQVRTHDVAIVKVVAPVTAKAGQTRPLTVSVANNRYPETVEVRLLKSSPQGFIQVGTLTKTVPVRGPYGSTPFAFSYTFTSDDAALGKVTFRFEALLAGGRDALPTNNVAVTSPTKITSK